MQTVRTVGSWQSTSEDLEDVPDDASWTTASSSEPVDVPLLPDPINHSRQLPSRPARAADQEDSIARQCWICLEDEDKALAFVNACSCTLACHPQVSLLITVGSKTRVMILAISFTFSAYWLGSALKVSRLSAPLVEHRISSWSRIRLL